MYNTKYRRNIIDTLQNTTMDGEETSVYDALSELKTLRTEHDKIMKDAAENWQADSQSEEGNEKNAERVRRASEINNRISAVKKAIEDLGIDYNDAELYVNEKGNDSVSNALDWLGTAATKGIATFNRGWSATLDLILGNPLKYFGWEDNPISSMANYYKDSLDNYTYDLAKKTEKLGGTNNKVLETSGELISGTVSALPDMIMAFMSGGTSTAASAASLSTKAAYETSNILGKAGITVQTMMNNPLYWTSFMREYGTDYEEAKAEGADDLAALFSSTISSFLNAGIEIGFDGTSGIQGLPSELINADKSAVRAWVESALDEGKEEVLQDIVNKLAAKTFYDHDKPMMTFGTGEGVLDPESISGNFGMGFGVGAILGGGPTILNSVFSRNSNVSQYDTLLENQGRRFSYMGNEILDFALKNTDLQYTSQALSRIADVNNMSYRDLGLLYLAEMVDTQVQFADSQTSEQIDTVADSFIADGEMAKYINESRSIYKQRLENNVNDYYSKQYVKSDNVSLPFDSDSDIKSAETTDGGLYFQNSAFNNPRYIDNKHKAEYNILENKSVPISEANSGHNNIAEVRDDNGNAVKIYRISEMNEDGSFSLKTSDGIISSEGITDGRFLKHLDFIRDNGLDIAAANSYLRHMNGNPLYGEAYNSIYQSAKSGLKDFGRVKSSMPTLTNVLGEKTAFAAFNLGKHAAGTDAKTQITKLDVIPQGKYSKSVSEKKTADTKTRDFLLKHIAEKSGLDIELSSLPYGENANFIANAARIVLSTESKNIIGSLFHETGEAGKAYVPEEYGKVKEAVIRWWLANNSKTYGDRVKLYKDVYEINGVKTSYQNASDELVCDAIGGLFADENGAESLFSYLEHDNMYTIKEKVGILEKINEIIDKIIGRIKALFAGMKLNSTQKTMLEAGLDEAEQIRGKVYDMIDALREKLKTISQDGSDRQSTDGDVRHSIEIAEDGSPVTVINTDQGLFAGLSENEYAKTAKNYINTYFKGKTLPLSEYNTVKIENTDKYVYSGKQYDDRMNKAKMKASTELDNLLAASKYDHHSTDRKSHKFAKDGFDYYTTIFIVDGQVFEGLFDIGLDGNNAVFYGMSNIKRITSGLEKYVSLIANAHSSINVRDNPFIKNSIPQKSGSVNSQYTQNSKKNTRHQFDIDDDEIDVDEIDFSSLKNYTKRTYDKFGWVKVNNVLSLNEYQRFFSKLGEIKTGTKFNKDYFGDYIIPTGEIPGIENVLVYTDGKFTEPNIEKVVRINSVDATEIDFYEREYIDYGRDLSKSYIIQQIRRKEIFVEYTKSEYGSYGQIRALARKRSNGKTNSRDIGDDGFGGGSDTSYQLDVSEHNNGKGTEENGVRYQLDIFEKTDNDEDISYNKEKGAEGNERNEKGLLSESGNGRRTHIEILQPQYYRRGISGGEKTNRGISEFRRITKGRVTRQTDSENRTELTYESDRVKRVYKFKNIPVQKASSEAQKAYNLFNKAGLETYVIDIDSYKVHENGKIKNGNFYALTACNGQVILINNNLQAGFAGSKELFVHEKIHIDLKSNDPKVRERAEIFHDTVLKNIAENSIVYKKFFECFMYPYIK